MNASAAFAGYWPGTLPERSRDIARRAAQGLIGYRRRRTAWARRIGLQQSGDSPDRERIRADAAAMAAVASGDQAAFTRLVREVAPILLRFARATLVATPAEAEEVVQESLVRLWRQAPSWRPDAQVSTWLHRVAYRLCIDRLRSRRPSIEIDAVEDEIVDPAPLPGARLSRLEDVRAVQAAVDALPERQRAAIILCHYQGLSQSEASAIMGIGEEAYESLLARGRRRLRAELAGKEDT